MEEFRALTEWEENLVSRLMRDPFPGRNQLLMQLQNAKVRRIDDNGSLEIQVSSKVKAGVQRRIPVEAECSDHDGTKIHFLLHVVNGLANEIEIYKEDGSRILSTPAADKLELV